MTDPNSEKTEEVKIRMLPDGRMTRKNAAAYLGYAEKTLAMWKTEGKGPKVTKFAGRVFYQKAHLDDFIGCQESAA